MGARPEQYVQQMVPEQRVHRVVEGRILRLDHRQLVRLNPHCRSCKPQNCEHGGHNVAQAHDSFSRKRR